MSASPAVKLMIGQAPGSRLYAVIEDAARAVYDPATQAFRSRVNDHRDPAVAMVEDPTIRGLFTLDLTAIGGLDGGQSYTVYALRDDVCVRAWTNLGGLVSSRDDWVVSF